MTGKIIITSHEQSIRDEIKWVKRKLVIYSCLAAIVAALGAANGYYMFQANTILPLNLVSVVLCSTCIGMVLIVAVNLIEKLKDLHADADEEYIVEGD